MPHDYDHKPNIIFFYYYSQKSFFFYFDTAPLSIIANQKIKIKNFWRGRNGQSAGADVRNKNNKNAK